MNLWDVFVSVAAVYGSLTVHGKAGYENGYLKEKTPASGTSDNPEAGVFQTVESVAVLATNLRYAV